MGKPLTARSQRRIITTLIVVGVLAALYGLGIWAVYASERTRCAWNLRAIGQVLIPYANDNRGQLPPDLGTLAITEDVTAPVFTCRATNTSAPANLPADQLKSWVNANADYIYIGGSEKLFTNSQTVPTQSNIVAQTVLAYEKDENHQGKGMNVLFADGHVEWITIDAAHQAVAATLAGRVRKPSRSARNEDSSSPPQPRGGAPGRGDEDGYLTTESWSRARPKTC